MRNLSHLLVAFPLLASQVASSLPSTATEFTRAQAQVDGSKNQTLTLELQNPSPVQIKLTQADFDAEILVPLKAEQAARAQAEAEAAKRRRQRRVVRVAPATGDVWYRLRLCEAGNNYTRNSGNGYYGAYQFDIRTWNNYGGFARADLAPAEVQDAKAHETHARRGWTPWPGCARKLGLL
jgi:hypothetical protein